MSNRIRLAAALASMSIAACAAGAAQWQWAVPVDAGQRMAYLWIPPSCQHVRGLIVGDQNMLEQPCLESPIIRQAAEKASLGIVLFIPKAMSWFKYKDGADKILLKALADLAKASGYSEVEFAPLIPIGHSASTPFAWYVGFWQPQRTIAVISMKGSSFPAPEFDKDALAVDVPAIEITGEYFEWPSDDKSRLTHWPKDRDVLLRVRAKGQRDLLSFFVDVSRGHFDFTDDLAKIVAMYITKASQCRLSDDAPLDGPVTLKKIDPDSGYLTDPDTVLAKHAAPVPAKDYQGDKAKMFWAFDKEMAEAMDRYAADQKTKKYQMLTFFQDGQPLNGPEDGYPPLRFEPSGNDEMSVKVAGGYLDRTPAGLPNQGPLDGHSNAPLQFICTLGPAVKTGVDTFRLQFNRVYRTPPTSVQLLIFSPGDDTYRMAFQPAGLTVPACKAGAAQKITFDKIADQAAGAKSVELKATSDSGLPVEFFVRYGPAEVEGNRLVFGPIPPRAAGPVKVCVVAYQWGRMKEPPIQTAPVVEQVFNIILPTSNLAGK